MQINNTTNTHNKNLSFGKLHLDTNTLAPKGSKFAKELAAAAPKLKERYGGERINVYLGDSCVAEAKKPANLPQEIFPSTSFFSVRYELKPQVKKYEILKVVAAAVKEARHNLRQAFHNSGSVDKEKAKRILDKMN